MTNPDAIPTVNGNAAGPDIGANEIDAAVPADRDEAPVRRFGTFTGELTRMASWLRQCGIDTVATEATGVYGIPPYQILESAGLEVCLVNARCFHNVPGRMTDVSDCQWLQRLHSAGLCVLRSLARYRDNLIRQASTHVLHMQKALDQMNAYDQTMPIRNPQHMRARAEARLRSQAKALGFPVIPVTPSASAP